MQNKHTSGFTIESDYEYVLGEKTGMLMQLEAVLQKPSDFIQMDLEHIAEEMVSTAKWFAESQLLRDTGNLIDNIQYDKGAISQGRIVLQSAAQNPKGEYYGGHHEFGYHTRNGNFIEARPYLRPAMRAVSQASLGRLSSAALEVSGFAGGMGVPKFNKNGVFGINSRYIRAFYRNIDHNYTVSGLKAKNGGLISRNFGKSYSINRRDSNKSGFNEYRKEGGGTLKVKWDSPYSSYNANKMSYIYNGNNPNAWRY